jgi:hypothetical protein
MIKSLVPSLVILSLCATALGEVVRPAPNFAIAGIRASSTLRSFRGQTVVLIITRSARDKYFRDELYRLKELYGQFANEKVIFVAAIETGPANINSDIPFVTAASPAQVASDYGVSGRFAIAVIGTDGNLDLITVRPINASRVKDMIFNNYDSQEAARKQPEQ